ncbi:efflux RND transporter periplasmic adaptor subunit [Porticoccus sp.]
MNKLLLSIVVVLVALGGYWLGGGFARPGMGSGESAAEREPLYWVAPMDPNFRRDQPGKSPMGMDLVPVYEAPQGDVSISPAVQQNLGVRIGSVTSGPLARLITTVGYIQLDEEQLSHVHTRVDGWVERLAVSSVGDRVSQGDPLFALYSPALVNVQEDYLAARRSNSRGLIDASRQRLLSLGLDAGHIAALEKSGRAQQAVLFTAPRSGILTGLKVREGMFVTPSLEMMAIGRLDSVWVIAEVLERQAGWLAPGQPVSMTLASYPGEVWSGQVEYIYPELNEMTRTTQLRIRFDNADWRLRPNMYAQLDIQAGDGRARLSVPREAVIRGSKVDRVVMRMAGGSYRSVPVRTGMESADRVEILDGLREGDEVVVSGQFLIDSESNLDAELERMGEAGASHTHQH